ncbi:hypothetical protein [Mucilaginibacter paludis]|uniref:YtxH domain-containing protein n=1 Tax=Mucilaginibacter paludis DSM 18603 TaxID=714943 RepID=H1Y009_9SPHI|nr:hypothetical protein [Mucilaginibacter paludis]EHQ27851.1 hypothetical protein Mucpa_3753 [Mucilaginibacter paludis DSM 18603]
MGLIRSLIIGAAVTYGIKKITKPRADGSSILSDIKNNPNDLVQKAKDFISGKASAKTDPQREPYTL